MCSIHSAMLRVMIADRAERKLRALVGRKGLAFTEPSVPAGWGARPLTFVGGVAVLGVQAVGRKPLISARRPNIEMWEGCEWDRVYLFRAGMKRARREPGRHTPLCVANQIPFAESLGPAPLSFHV